MKLLHLKMFTRITSGVTCVCVFQSPLSVTIVRASRLDTLLNFTITNFDFASILDWFEIDQKTTLKLAVMRCPASGLPRRVCDVLSRGQGCQSVPRCNSDVKSEWSRECFPVWENCYQRYSNTRWSLYLAYLITVSIYTLGGWSIHLSDWYNNFWTHLTPILDGHNADCIFL